MRIHDHHPYLTGVERGASCQITIDGRQYEAFAGETIATVMLANGRFLSPSPTDQPGVAGFFCGIGTCYGCQVRVNGRLMRTCTTLVQPDMVIETSTGETQ